MLSILVTNGMYLQSFDKGLRMPRKRLMRVEWSADAPYEPSRRASKYALPNFDVVRPKMIPMAAGGVDNHEIAARL